MGLLESVLGSVLAGQGQGQAGGAAGGLGNILGGMLGGQPQQQAPGGAGGGLNMGMIMALAPILMSMLANNSQSGGLGGLLNKFQNAGLGDAAGSWVGTGQNQAVTGAQVTQALGPDVIGNIASQLGVGHSEAAGGVAQLLPELINKLTPQGQAPQGGLGSTDDIMGMLGKMLSR